MESDAKGSSPTREDVLVFAVPALPQNELGGGRAAASTMLLRSTELEALIMGSTSTLGWPGGRQTASRKTKPVS